ncbi:MAG TPA: NAD-dependent epimerase/dehydratase family protein [Gemmatimonadota bacterium]|jgi:UDP-glucose 4-epimerase|nr:NAD-dependent epimerase/dehydratase family protein [Gemmatimonadota bacterium]
MRVLITGGAGFIGSHLAEFHLERGDEVHCVDDLSTGTQENVARFGEYPEFRFDRADIRTWEGLTEAVSLADRVYHMAAVVGMFRVLAEPEAVLSTNVAGTERVLRCAAEAGNRPRVLVASSSEVYGPVGTHRLDETDALLVHCDTAKTQWNYALSKLAGEALGITYSGSFDVPVTIARLFNTTGPRQSGRYGMVVPRFVRQAALGEPLTVFGDGLQTRSFCHVGDTVRAIHLLCESDAAEGEIVNVGNDRAITMLDLANLVRAMAGSDSPVIFVPDSEAYYHGFVGIRHRKPALDKLKRLVAFEPEHTLEDTITDLLAAVRPVTEGTKAAG